MSTAAGTERCDVALSPTQAPALRRSETVPRTVSTATGQSSATSHFPKIKQSADSRNSKQSCRLFALCVERHAKRPAGNLLPPAPNWKQQGVPLVPRRSGRLRPQGPFWFLFGPANSECREGTSGATLHLAKIKHSADFSYSNSLQGCCAVQRTAPPRHERANKLITIDQLPVTPKSITVCSIHLPVTCNVEIMSAYGGQQIAKDFASLRMTLDHQSSVLKIEEQFWTC